MPFLFYLDLNCCIHVHVYLRVNSDQGMNQYDIKHWLQLKNEEKYIAKS